MTGKTRTSIRFLLAPFVVAALLPCGAQAAAISGLYDTGASLLAGNADAHWQLSGGTAYASVSADGYPFNHAGDPVGARYWDNYSGPYGSALWIHPTVDPSTSLDPTSNGTYLYTLQFSLTGANPLTAWMHFAFEADDIATVSLNGTIIGGNTNLTGGPYGRAGYNTWTGINTRSIDGAESLFREGTNSLTFSVTNLAQSEYNATGLRVHFKGSDVQAAQVPVPGSLTLLALGLVAASAGMRGRLRRQYTAGLARR